MRSAATYDQGLIVIADDLTGALDAGLQFAARGLETSVALHLTPPHMADVVVLNTDTRSVALRTAMERMRAAAWHCQGRAVFKKIDSTLRGHVGPECVALRDALGLRSAVVAPAFVEAGRTAQQGQLLVRGLPVHQTSLAHDPQWPAQTADVQALVGRGLAETPILVPLATVRRGAAAVQAQVEGCALAVAESETPDDLAIIARAIIAAGGRTLPCGSAGLAAAWADALQLGGQHAATWGGATGPVLLVAGSHNAATQGQLLELRGTLPVAWFELDDQARSCSAAEIGSGLAAALTAGQDAVLSASFGALRPGAALQIAQLLGKVAGEALHTAHVSGKQPAGLVLTGGDTALQVCAALQIESLSIMVAIEPGIPGSLVSGGAWGGLPVVTKAGGFGSPQALAQAVRWIKAGGTIRGGRDGT